MSVPPLTKVNMPSKRVIIVGAGISGLAVAYRLQERSPSTDITILEQDSRPGGTAWTLHEDGFQLEIGPNGFLDTKPATVNLCRDVGLGREMIEASDAAANNRFLWLGERLRLLPGSLGAFVRSDLLTWRAKINIMLERWRGPAAPASDESIDRFARRRAGAEVADLFADALVTGIYAGDPRLLSLPACFPRLAHFEQEYGSVLKGFAKAARLRHREAQVKGEVYQRPGKMWSLRTGMRRLMEELAGSLKQPPIYGVAAARVERSGNPDRPAWTVVGSGTERRQADAVVLTCPAHQQAGLLADVGGGLAEEIAAIPYNRVAVIGLGYRRADVPMSLDGFGFIAPQNTRRDLLGVQWCSSIFPGRAPEGAVLLRAMCGGWYRADIVGWDDTRLLSAVRAELRCSMGVTAAPIYQRIIRWDRAIPQYHVGHLQRLRRVDSRLLAQPGLFLGGNAYRGVALNDCTEQGEVLAERVSAYLGSGAKQTVTS